MKSINIIVLLLLLVTYCGCEENEEKIDREPLEFERIRQISVFYDEEEDGQLFSFLYNQDSNLIEIRVDSGTLVEYTYSGDLLTSYETWQARKYYLIYKDENVVSIDMEYFVPEDIPIVFDPPYFEIDYQHNPDGSFVRRDSSVLYDYSSYNSPPQYFRSTHTATLDKIETITFMYFEMDSLEITQTLIENKIIYNETAQNVFLKWDFPIAYNIVPFLPFFITDYNFSVKEIFFVSQYLPAMLIMTRNGKLARTTTFEYSYTDQLLTEIKVRIEDHEGRLMMSEHRAEIDWE